MSKLSLHHRVSFAAQLGIAALSATLGLGLVSACSGTGGAGTTGPGGGDNVTSSTTSVTSTTSTTSSGSAGGSGGGGGMMQTGCKSDAECTGNPKGNVCDTSNGQCVVCLPTNDPCPTGQYCDPTSHVCNQGCKDDTACAGDPNGTLCNTQTHLCVGCLSENDCTAGQICATGVGICVPGCSATHACPGAQECCNDTCIDTSSDPNHCGSCTKTCTPPQNASASCNNGICGLKACLPAFADCNGNMADGCEWNKLQDGNCVCVPGASQSCYQGLPGTQGVGPCKAGVQTCDAMGTGWGPCIGQVLPKFEICGNNVDEDCNGVSDDVPDMDGDGWTLCNGDCNDGNKLVNPGALEVVGDGVDNDCDATTSDTVAPAACATATKFAGVTGTDVARAMELCNFTTASPPKSQMKWGVISATQTRADGSAVAAEAQSSQTAITTLFGNTIGPKKGTTMAIISSGMARDANDTGWVTPIFGSQWSTAGSAITFPGGNPLGYYTSAHNGGLLPGACAGSACPVGSGANDSINIRLQIRTPTNAQGFSYDFRFFSAEYQTFQCTSFNDYYLAILQTGATIPADKNISFDSLGNAVSVNNGFFQDCGGNGKSCGTCPFGTAALAGTGFDGVSGGATEWLTTDAPIIPGETIILNLMVFDVQDHAYDTLVLLDNFRWQLAPVVLGTHT